MIQTKPIGRLTQLTATDGYLHKIGTDIYTRSTVMLPSDTIDMYEELAQRPAYSKTEYEALVATLVRERYSESEEFALQRKALNLMLDPDTIHTDIAAEFAAYNAYVEQCKTQAKQTLQSPTAQKPITQ